MEIVIFLVFVGVCAFALVWSTRKSDRRPADLERRKRLREKKVRSEKLETPRDHLLSHRDEVWESRRKKANGGVVRTNAFVPRFESSGTPEYDGYSRRDRHHVRERTAEIKKEPVVEEHLTMTAIEVEFDLPDNSKTASRSS